MLNINVGHNKELLKACKTLGDYSEYVHRARTYAKEMSIEEAVDKAIDECIKEDILREFLEKNRHFTGFPPKRALFHSSFSHHV